MYFVRNTYVLVRTTGKKDSVAGRKEGERRRRKEEVACERPTRSRLEVIHLFNVRTPVTSLEYRVFGGEFLGAVWHGMA